MPNKFSVFNGVPTTSCKVGRLELVPLELVDSCLIVPAIHYDFRGKFFEAWRKAEYKAILNTEFVQENVSVSNRGTTRGLHFQKPRVQGKLVSVFNGQIFDVIVDLRLGSPTFKRSIGILLQANNPQQLWVPPGFAHGFQALRPNTVVQYKCTDIYDPTGEHSIRYDDPDLKIEWPLECSYVSKKDLQGRFLRSFEDGELFYYNSNKQD